MTHEEQQLVSGIQAMYDALMAGDRPGFDVHLDPGTTTWESHFPELFDRAALDAHRDLRPAGYRPPLAAITVHPVRTEIWDGTALVAYDLHLVPHDGPVTPTRVTDVLRRDPEGAWRIVHHHAQTLEPAA